MWLRLYQSASIWLVFGLSRCRPTSSTVPQVQIGWSAHRQQDRGGGGNDQDRRAIAARRRRHRGQA